MFGINEKVYEKLISYFERNEDIIKVILFGSRAKGNEKHNSDIDLWIECERKSEGIIKYDIDEIIGCYSCDVLFNYTLNEEIQKQIKRDGIEIYKVVR